MGDLYNQLTGQMGDKPLSEKAPGRLELAVTAPEKPDQDKAVRVLNAARKTGLPQDVITENLDDIEARMTANDFDADKFRTESPLVAEWLAKSPSHAAAMSTAERDNWSWFEKVTNSIKESYENERDMKERSALLLRELNGETLSPMETARREKLLGDMAYRASKHEAETTSEYVARTNTSGVAQMAGSTIESIKGGSTAALGMGLVVGAATKNPALTQQAMTFGFAGGSMISGAAYSYRQETPQIFDDLRNMKDVNGNRIDINTARDVAKLTGTINAVIETASTAAVMSLIPGVKGIVSRSMGVDVAKKAVLDQVKLALMRPTTAAAVKAAAIGFVAGPSTEALEEFMQALVAAGGRELAQGMTDQYFTPDDFGKDLESAASQGKDAFVGSIFAMGLPTGGSRLYSGLHDAKMAAKHEQYYKDMGEVMSKSELAKVSPESAAEVVEAITANAPSPDVFIDATQWRTYFQNKNIDPQEAARQVWGTTEEYDNAMKSDTPMRLPIADFATKIATTEHIDFFSKEVRSEPNAMNAREVVEMQKEMENMVKDESEKYKSLREEITSRLVKIGYEQTTADTSAANMAAFFEVTSKRLGISDPMALFERYGVNIERGTDLGVSPGGVKYAQDDDFRKFLAAATDPTEVTKADKATQELGNFAMSLGEKVAARMERTKALTDEAVKRGAFIFKEGDVVQSNKTGKIYSITGVTVHEPSKKRMEAGASVEPRYQYKSEGESQESGQFIASKAHEGFTLINRSGSQQLYKQTKGETETPSQKLNRLGQIVLDRRQQPRGVSPLTGQEGADFFAAARAARAEEAMVGGGEGADFLGAVPRKYRQIKRTNPFPDSKIQKELYHFTMADFNEFDINAGQVDGSIHGLDVWNLLGAHFGDKRTAETVGMMKAEGYEEGDLPTHSRTIPVFVNMKNPLFVGSEDFVFTVGEPMDPINWRDNNTPDAVKVVFDNAFADWEDPMEVASAIRRGLIELGYDGISYKNDIEGGGKNSYIVFSYGQISNAITNELMQDETKGYISIGPDKKINIAMMENSDLSTFVHESGHLYLEVLRDIASPSGWENLKSFLGQDLKDGDERAAMLEDLQKISKWLGADNLDNITVEQHEQFARGIEAYLMEGRAPSVELRPVFARIKAWMVALYKTIDALHVRINPEIRGVFDRLFAGQEAIDAANKEAEVVPVFATKEDANMSETEFAAYSKLLAEASQTAQDRLQQKIMAQMQREQKAEWKRRRVEIRDQIAEQVSKQPEYVLLEFLAQPDNKLSRDVLQAMYPEKFADNLVMQGLRNVDAYRSKEGLDPQMVAEAHGYKTADEMVRAAIEAPPYDKFVEEQTDVRMKELYGDILTDGTLADEAKKQVMGPGRGDVLIAELKALRKRQREARPVVSAVVREARAIRTEGMEAMQTVIPSLAAVRAVAVDTIARMRIRHIVPQTYLIAARNASKDAVKAVHKGDYGMAAYHKQKELLNHALYREGQKAKQEVENISKYMRTFEESGVRERLSRAGDFYIEQIDAILERFDFSRMSTKDADKRKSLVQWIESQKAKGIDINLSDDLLNEAYRKPWKEMTYDELVAVSDGAKHIRHMAAMKNKLLKSKAGRELNATIALIDETMSINARHADSRQRETRLPQEAAGHSIASFFGAHRKIASLAREMDGFKDGGPVWESIIWPLNEAAATEAMEHEKSNAKLHALFAPYTKVSEQAKTLLTTFGPSRFATGMYKQEFIPEINDSLSKAGRLMVALNWGNESNRQRIMDGYKWTSQQVEAILAPLTKEDWDFVQGVIDHFESFWPQVEGLAKRVDGVAPKKVEAAQILTPHGVYRGGYFPLVYDDRQSPKAYANLAKEAADRAMHGAAIRASTAHGERINRVANVKMPVRLDFGVITEALNETIHDITHYETLIDLNRVIGNPRIQSSMVAHFGYEAYQQFRSALRDIAGGDIPAQTQVDKSLNWLRKGTTIASMGWNVSTALMQPLGATQSIVRAGVIPFARGVGRWLGDAAHMESTTKWIYEKSMIMQERSVTQSREINEIRNQVSAGGLLSPIQDSYFYMIVKMQQVVDIPTWIGAYERGLEQFNGDEAKAVAVADQVVLDSQGGGQIKDMAAVQRGGPAQKLWTNFYSYFSTTFNLTAESYRKNKLTNPYEAGRFAVDMLLLYTIPALLSMFIRDALKGDIEDDEEKLLKKIAQNQLSYLLGPVLLAREFGSAIQGFYGYEGPAGAQFFSQTSKFIKQAGQGDADEAMFRALNRSAGVLFHYPAGQVQRTVEGIMYNVDNGSINPVPLLAGPPKDN